MRLKPLFFAIVGVLTSFAVRASTLDTLFNRSWEEDRFIKTQETKNKAAELDRFARFLPNNPTRESSCFWG